MGIVPVELSKGATPNVEPDKGPLKRLRKMFPTTAGTSSMSIGPWEGFGCPALRFTKLGFHPPLLGGPPSFPLLFHCWEGFWFLHVFAFHFAGFVPKVPTPLIPF